MTAAFAAALFPTLLTVHAEAQPAQAQPEPAASPAPQAPSAPAASLDEAPVAPVALRPRFEVALGMGVSFDNVGLADGRTVAVPSFQVQGGVGEGGLGFELRMFSSAADGRYHEMNKVTGTNDMAVDRLAVDLMLAWRPLFGAYQEDSHYVARMLRSATIDVGLAVENVSQSQKDVTRSGGVLGAHIDFPLTPVTDASELRVRLVARRMVARQGKVGSSTVSDSWGEAFGALAFVF